MVTYFRLAFCGLVVIFVMMCAAPYAKACYYGVSDISYTTSSGILAGYSATTADWFEYGQFPYCYQEAWDELLNQWYCPEGGYYDMFSKVTSRISVPSGGSIPVGTERGYDVWAGYAIYPNEYGTWATVGDHYISRDTWAITCYSAQYYDCSNPWFYETNEWYFGTTAATVQVDPPYLHVDGKPMEDCGEVTRGQEITAKLENYALLQNINWSFIAGDLGATNQNQGNHEWGGIMVKTGRIRVDFVGGSVECHVSVNNRDWNLQKPPLVHPNGAPNGSYNTTFPADPVRNGNDAGLGEFKWLVNNDPGNNSLTQVPSGPNKDWGYYTAPPTLMADFMISPAIDVLTTQFAHKQCGNYSSANGGNGGFIGRVDLRTQTYRHEVVAPVKSHYGQMGVILATGFTNPGTVLQTFVWGPNGPAGSETYAEFAADLILILDGIKVNIDSFVGSHTNVPDVNKTESNVPLGNINYSPFQTAPLCP